LLKNVRAEPPMTTVSFQVSYVGDALKEHAMDVEVFAPAVLALGDLCKQANYLLNGDRAKVNLQIKADIKQNCILVDFNFIQTIYEQIRGLLDDEKVKTAKDILEWLQILIPAGAATLGVFGFLKYRKGRQIESTTEIDASDGTGNVIVKFEGQNNSITVNNNVLHLSNDPKIQISAAKLLDPLRRPGIEKIEFKDRDKTTNIINKEEADSIRQSTPLAEPSGDTVAPQVITARLIPHRPVLDEKAKTWQFRYLGNKISVDISNTTIAKDTMKRGGVGVRDAYIVNMEISEDITPGGVSVPRYRVLDVQRFMPGPVQTEIPMRRKRSSKKEPN
jgi:hypothetical protein